LKAFLSCGRKASQFLIKKSVTEMRVLPTRMNESSPIRMNESSRDRSKAFAKLSYSWLMLSKRIASARLTRWLKDSPVQVALVGLLVVLIALPLYIMEEASWEFGSTPNLPVRHEPLEPLTVDASWILEGKPTFRHHAFSKLASSDSLAGIWECDGPAKFIWKLQTDETLYVLDGHVEIEYLGVAYSLHPGSVAEFPAGSTVHWNVPNHIRKAFTISQPGRVRRLLRKFFPAAAAVRSNGS
jgi:uncharacterized cupin superfamily protein